MCERELEREREIEKENLTLFPLRTTNNKTIARFNRILKATTLLTFICTHTLLQVRTHIHMLELMHTYPRA